MGASQVESPSISVSNLRLRPFVLETHRPPVQGCEVTFNHSGTRSSANGDDRERRFANLGRLSEMGSRAPTRDSGGAERDSRRGAEQERGRAAGHGERLEIAGEMRVRDVDRGKSLSQLTACTTDLVVDYSAVEPSSVFIRQPRSYVPLAFILPT